MPIPKYRLVQYEEDGVYAYQCLNCYKGWNARNDIIDWKFCPHCGIRWEGQHECKEHSLRHYYPDYKFQTPRLREREEYYWELQTQTVWGNEPPKPNEWQYFTDQVRCDLKSEHYESREQYFRAVMAYRLRYALRKQSDTMFPAECRKLFRLARICRYYTALSWREIKEVVATIPDPKKPKRAA